MSRRCGIRIIMYTLAALVLAVSAPAWAAPPLAGKLIYLQGQVAVRRGPAGDWVAAEINQPLYQGDEVMTGPASRAAILSLDESQIKLNENTTLFLKSVVPSPRLRLTETVPGALESIPRSLYKLLKGELWLRNNKEEFRFEMETPAVTATIRGTEFNVQVLSDGATILALLEGRLLLHNPYGELMLNPGEEGVAHPGKAPYKRILVQPTDAVQWSLYYPGVISFRDLPLSGPGAGPLAAAFEAYDQGHLLAAQQEAEALLLRHPQEKLAHTLLGWLSLQRHQPQEALAHFRRAGTTEWRSVVGLALAYYRLGDAPRANAVMQQARRELPPSPYLGAMSGFFNLMVGKTAEARRELTTAASRSGPAAVLAGSYLAQMDVAQNRRDEALVQASQVLAQAPDSPLAHLSMGIVRLSLFDQAAAKAQFEKALVLDPNLLEGYLYLTRLWLGGEYLNQAWKTVNRALRLAPQEAEVLSLAGFVRLAFRDFTGASTLFHRAVQANPRLGEPHIGLAICHFRYRENDLALTAMLTATLLDPRISSYQSELGRALYQVRAFDKSLEVYDYAKKLDPLDPTPYLYKGIALSDLNRPGEAVQEINRAIELNNNVAMFRSRSLLDRDLAVRNTSLARSYLQLGLTEWGYSKAVTAVNYAPYNSSAHLFLRDVLVAARSGTESPFLTGGLLFGTQQAEATLYRVLAPANQNTFSNLQLEGTEALGLSNNYTFMFEMPYVRLGAAGAAGAGERSKFIQSYQGFVYGGAPGLAVESYGKFTDDRALSWPADTALNSFNGAQRLYDIEADVKWEPTVQGTLSGFVEYLDGRFNSASASDIIHPLMGIIHQTSGGRIQQRTQFYELSYFYRVNPETAFLAYYAHRNYPIRIVNDSALVLDGLALQRLFSQTFDLKSHNVQLQQHFSLSGLGTHNCIAGFDYFTIPGVSQRLSETIPPFTQSLDYRSPQWNYSFYFLDYWRPRKNLVLELSLYKDFYKGVRAGFQENIYRSMWSPGFGVNYQFTSHGTQHVLRGAVSRSLNTHFMVQPLLVPPQIAGFPWLIDTNSGTEVRQAGVGWEAQWNPRTFTVLRLSALRLSTPTFFTDGAGLNLPTWQTWKRYQASLILNRILAGSLGLSAGIMGKRVIPDLSYEDNGLKAYAEINAFLGLAYLHPRGWLARLKPLLVQQYGSVPGHEADNPFVILNLTLGREFPQKRGFALLEVQNLFNRRAFYSLEPYRDLEFANQRRILARLGFYF